MIATLTVNSLITGQGTNYPIVDARGFASPVVDVAKSIWGGRHGASVPRVFWRDRRITLTFAPRAATPSAYATLRTDLLKAFDLPRSSNTLIQMTTTDGKSLQFNANIRNAIQGDFQPGFVTTGKIRVELIVPDPNILGQTLNETTFSPAVAGGTTLPAALPLAFASSGGSAVIVNNGNGSSFPVIRITGPATNPHARNSTLNQELIINTTIPAGSFVDIDLDAQTVLLNGVTNYLQFFTGDWWYLVPGNNTVNFSSDDNDPLSSLRIQWRSAFLGI